MLIEIHAAQSGPRQADSAGFGRFGQYSASNDRVGPSLLMWKRWYKNMY
jgi:hypothetical protein